MDSKEHIIWENFDDYSEYNHERIYDERINLNIKLVGRILVIASLGLWNGKRQGYSILDSRNISDILYSDCEYCKWYADNKNILSIQAHHDGRNYLTYREIKEDMNIEELTDSIYNNEEITDEILDKYTKSILPEVAEVYGWEIEKVLV